MDRTPYRPRVSRETRLLLVTAIIAVGVLWILARMRFPDRPTTSNPIAPVLTQLASGPKFDELASEMTQLQSHVESTLVIWEVVGKLRPLPALRISENVAVTWSDLDPGSLDGGVMARDPGSGLMLVRVPSANFAPATPWMPRRLQQSKYFAATDSVGRFLSLRPVFVGRLEQVESSSWSAPVWAIPDGADVARGAFIFTNDAELAGLVLQDTDRLVILPTETLLAESLRLLDQRGEPAGEIGIRVQSLTPSLSAATGAKAGVVLTWVDESSVVGDKLAVGDVVETFEGHAVATPQQWEMRVKRLRAGETFSLQVRKRGSLQELRAVAPARSVAAVNQALGLIMRRSSPWGAQVVRVEAGSVAARAGVIVGDIITLAADTSSPTPGEIRRIFASAPAGRPILIALTRAEDHHVMTLVK